MVALPVMLFVALLPLVTSSPILPKDCEDIQQLGYNATAIYMVYPERTSGVYVRCDMDTDAGGWTVIQRRVSASDFYQDWAAYQLGFGDLNTNFWLGNLQIYAITNQNWYQLRVDMTHANGTTAYAVYDKFSVGDVESKYRLNVAGYHGNAGDSLMRHNGHRFSTKDSDNDIYSGNCAGRYVGAFWYDRCHLVNINGVYGSSTYGRGLNWRSFTGYYSSLTKVEMKVKRFIPERLVQQQVMFPVE